MLNTLRRQAAGNLPDKLATVTAHENEVPVFEHLFHDVGKDKRLAATCAEHHYRSLVACLVADEYLIN